MTLTLILNSEDVFTCYQNDCSIRISVNGVRVIEQDAVYKKNSL